MRNTLIRDQNWSMSPVFGLEASYKKLIFLRGGVGNFQSTVNFEQTAREVSFQPNLGVGIKLGPVHIDYALTDIGDQSTALYSNVFSLRFNINSKKTKE
jgi:hypothetical protein